MAFLFLYLHFLPYNKHGKTKRQINYLLFKILFFNGKWNRAAGKVVAFLDIWLEDDMNAPGYFTDAVVEVGWTGIEGGVVEHGS